MLVILVAIDPPEGIKLPEELPLQFRELEVSAGGWLGEGGIDLVIVGEPEDGKVFRGVFNGQLDSLRVGEDLLVEVAVELAAEAKAVVLGQDEELAEPEPCLVRVEQKGVQGGVSDEMLGTLFSLFKPTSHDKMANVMICTSCMPSTLRLHRQCMRRPR